MTTNQEVLSRFEEGVPADPTENMSPEDAKKWREENERNKDRFKTATSKHQVVSWMRRNVDDHVDNRTGEVNMTSLAEDAAGQFDRNGLGDWLDDETHWVWDAAHEVANWYERNNRHARVVDRFSTDLQTQKSAGFSYKTQRMSVLFVEGRKPVPFNSNTIQAINRTSIPIVGDDGEMQDVSLRVVGHQSSRPLTGPQEKLGWRREVRVDIDYPVDQGGNPASSARSALSELAALGKSLGFRVEPEKPGYKPQTRRP